MKIAIFGAGFVGLSSAVCFAQKFKTTLIDVDHKKILGINSKNSYIAEEGLEELLEKAIDTKNLIAKEITDVYTPSDLIFIAVGTPSDTDGYINLMYVRDVIKTIYQRKDEFLKKDGQTIIALKSTTVPGTTNRYLGFLEEKKLARVVYNPEFLSQGSAIRDTLHPNRVIIGSNTLNTSQDIKDFYTDFYQDELLPILTMSIESAEFAKYTANAFLATKISFANEIANIVEHVENADIDQILESIGYDSRISPKFFGTGIGFGGSCFPKDVRALIKFSENISAETPSLLTSTLKVNENRPLRLLLLLRQYLGSLAGKNIAILGLTFKPGTNDIREAPALPLMQALWRAGAEVRAHDPMLDKIPKAEFEKLEVKLCKSKEECLKDVDAVLIVTEWSEYQEFGLENLTKNMKTKLVIDGRRIFAKDTIPPDVEYLTIGSPIIRSFVVNNSKKTKIDSKESKRTL